jgi:hypothetical protein
VAARREAETDDPRPSALGWRCGKARGLKRVRQERVWNRVAGFAGAWFWLFDIVDRNCGRHVDGSFRDAWAGGGHATSEGLRERVRWRAHPMLSGSCVVRNCSWPIDEKKC